ncbi:hypothetical protein H5410_041102 [Solanum commersonii]|uniref:Reverse transcriptase domain-containing protein n=1 Tax=Solanum commersonii TaxID=4109 RepID=A0A9J5XTI9_SOLCO|nr:hypothetical protein H5410_041102 [Solanum commersonii]
MGYSRVYLINVVQGFIRGSTLPKCITHTNLILLPKKEVVQTFSDLSPISLSNFINKIIFRIIHNSVEDFLNRLTSTNQSEFVKGGSITDNVLLAMKIITNIKKRGKLDKFQDMIWRIVANNWDLNHLFFIHEFKIYDFSKWSDQLNHLAYAGDTIIFASTVKKSLQLIMEVLNHYENQSGHMINEGKSCLIGHARKKKIHFAELIKKIQNKLHVWKEEGKTKHWTPGMTYVCQRRKGN